MIRFVWSLCLVWLWSYGVAAFMAAPHPTLHHQRALVVYGSSPEPVRRGFTGLSMTMAPAAPTAVAPPARKAGSGYRLLDVASNRDKWKGVPDMWDYLVEECPDQMCLVDALHGNVTIQYTYREVRDNIVRIAGAMQALGVDREDCVSIFSENSHRWLISEQAVMMAGGCNAVRGTAAPVSELQYIYQNSDSMGIIVERAELLQKLLSEGDGLRTNPKFVCVLYSASRSGAQIQEELQIPADIKVVTYQELNARDAPFRPVELALDQKASLVYTSGTTSQPKGVVLRHRNLLHQVLENSFNRAPPGTYDPWVGDSFVSILPCWHIFERSAEYWILARGVQMVYSNVRLFKKDLARYEPQFVIAVPRLFETIYKGVQAKFKSASPVGKKLIAVLTAVSMLHLKASRIKRGLVLRDKAPSPWEKAIAAVVVALCWPLQQMADKLAWSKVRLGMGGKVKCLVSGGSALPGYLEDFFNMVNVKVLVGYGLTETSPVICSRDAENNLRGSVGTPPPGTTLKLVHPETREPVPVGEIGVICAKGPQVTSGYNKNPTATAAAIAADGFFDTGDLGRINGATGDLILTGRSKDTIVLNNGENVEPEPIEDGVVGDCSTVDQIMLVGQDQKFLSALVAVNPSGLREAALLSREEEARCNELLGASPLTSGVAGTPEALKEVEELLNTRKGVKEAVLAEVKKACKARNFRPWETVQDVYLRLEPFNMKNGFMTQTLKIKRNVVLERFKEKIASLYAEKD